MPRLTERLQRLAIADYCPLYLGWHPWSSTLVNLPLRQLASRCQARGRWPALRWLFLLLLTLTWPCRLLHLVGQTMCAFAPTITSRTGKSRSWQVMEQLWFGLIHALPPVAYYTYELYRPERRRWVDHYLHQHEASALLPYLNQDYQHAAMVDKAQFAQLCTQHQLPTVPTLGYCVAGESIWLAPVRADIFVKPRDGVRGEDTMHWQRLAADQFQDQRGNLRTWAALVTELEELSQQQAYLVQPCLPNHPAIAALSPGALATARIVTGRTPTGTVETVAATFKMAWQPSIINTHGLNSPIELTTGCLGRAYSYHPVCPGYDTHPVTGAMITGAILPDWSVALAVAVQAHQLFPGYLFLGWDVAFTLQGPVLLEGNSGWDVVTMQKPQGVGLAQTRFADICALWLQVR